MKFVVVHHLLEPYNHSIYRVNYFDNFPERKIGKVVERRNAQLVSLQGVEDINSFISGLIAAGAEVKFAWWSGDEPEVWSYESRPANS